jgi:hypothetical protein
MLLGTVQMLPAGAATSTQERTVVELRKLPPPANVAAAQDGKEARQEEGRAATASVPAALAERVEHLTTRGSVPQTLAEDVDCEEWESAWHENGVVIDHFSFCSLQRIEAELKVCIGTRCRTIGEAEFTVVTEGTGVVGAREVRYDVMLTDWDVDGIWQTFVFTVDVDCENDGPVFCNPGTNTGGRSSSINSWMRDPLVRVDWVSPLAGSTGVDQLAWYDFRTSLQLNANTPMTFGENGFRCDSATYVRGRQGCVFDHVEEIWAAPLDTGNPNQALQHIYDAQTAPDTTYPVWPQGGKTIPGSVASLEPLSRDYYDTSLRRANRRAAVAVCRNVWGTNYPAPKPGEPPASSYECDEYPFCSTYQGAAAGDNRFSARRIVDAHNTTGGIMLGTFYSAQRVLHDDPFFVHVYPTTNALPPSDPDVETGNCSGTGDE